MKLQPATYTSGTSITDAWQPPNTERRDEALDPVLPKKQVAKTPEDVAKERRDELDKVVGKMNATAELHNYNLRFEIVNKNRIVISVINTDTGEILRQIPPDDLVKAFQQMDDFLGLLVDKKV
jgi:flagellar protein FlaG